MKKNLNDKTVVYRKIPYYIAYIQYIQTLSYPFNTQRVIGRLKLTTKNNNLSNAGSSWVKKNETTEQIKSVAWQLKMISLNDPEKIDDSQLKIENEKKGSRLNTTIVKGNVYC